MGCTVRQSATWIQFEIGSKMKLNSTLDAVNKNKQTNKTFADINPSFQFSVMFSVRALRSYINVQRAKQGTRCDCIKKE